MLKAKQVATIIACALLTFGLPSQALSASEHEVICRQLDQSPINKKLLYQDNGVFDVLARRFDAALDGETVYIQYKIRPSLTTDCALRVYGSQFISELKEHRRPNRRHFDAVTAHPKVAVRLLSATYDTLSENLDFVVYGGQLAALLPQEILQASLIAQLEKFLENPYSPYTLRIGHFGRMATITRLPKRIVEGLEKVDYLKEEPGNRYFYLLDMDDAVVGLTLLHNVGVRFSPDRLGWLYTLLERDHVRFDKFIDLGVHLYESPAQAKAALTEFIDRLTKDGVIKNNEIPDFWRD